MADILSQDLKPLGVSSPTARRALLKECRAHLLALFGHVSTVDSLPPALKLFLADCAIELGRLLYLEHMVEGSSVLDEAALEMRRKLLPVDHVEVLTAKNNLAVDYLEGGDPGRAVPLLTEVAAGRKDALGSTHPDTLMAMNNLGNALALTGQFEEASRVHRSAIDLGEGVYGRDDPQVRMIRSSHGAALLRSGEPDEASEIFRDLAAAWSEEFGEWDSRALQMRTNELARELYKYRRSSEVPGRGVEGSLPGLAEWGYEILNRLESSGRGSDREATSLRTNVGFAFLALGQEELATECFRRASQDLLEFVEPGRL